MKQPIKKIVLDVGGKEVELTLEQAKTLFGALDEMFGEKQQFAPIYIERPYRWFWTYPLPNWGTTTVGTGDSGSGSTGITYDSGSSALRLTC